MVKPLYKSKTFWFGVAQIAFAAIGLFTGGMDVAAAYSMALTGAGTIGFRLTTTGPVTLQ